jgi:hypothetical protein
MALTLYYSKKYYLYISLRFFSKVYFQKNCTFDIYTFYYLFCYLKIHNPLLFLCHFLHFYMEYDAIIKNNITIGLVFPTCPPSNSRFVAFSASHFSIVDGNGEMFSCHKPSKDLKFGKSLYLYFLFSPNSDPIPFTVPVEP